MRHVRLAFLPVTLFLPLLAGCGGGDEIPTAEDIPAIMSEAAGTTEVSRRGDPPARRAVRNSFRTMLQLEKTHEAEIANRFSRPQLRSYFLLSDSYVGGDFPRQTATILREIQRLEQDYIALLQNYASVLQSSLGAADLSAETRAAIEASMVPAYNAAQQPAIETHRALESFAGSAAQLYELVARRPSSIKSMRTGLEIDDGALLAEFNRQVDVVNAAHERLDRAIRSLGPEQQASFRRMNVATPQPKKAQ